MRNSDTFRMPSLPVLLTRSFTLLVVCILSTFFLAASPDAHAASHSITRATDFPSVYIYLDHRKVHDDENNGCKYYPYESCTVIDFVDAGWHTAFCQAQGESISDLGYTNNWWTSVQTPSGTVGWVSNLYIRGDEKIAGIPYCENGNGVTPV